MYTILKDGFSLGGFGGGRSGSFFWGLGLGSRNGEVGDRVGGIIVRDYGC